MNSSKANVLVMDRLVSAFDHVITGPPLTVEGTESTLPPRSGEIKGLQVLRT